MSDDNIVTSDIIDIGQLIKRRRASTCEHINVIVDHAIQSLACADCDAELDPWWWLRMMSKRGEDAIVKLQAQRDEYDQWHARAIETALRLQRDIQELTDTKNKLQNEIIDGHTISTHHARMRRRRIRTPRQA